MQQDSDDSGSIETTHDAEASIRDEVLAGLKTAKEFVGHIDAEKLRSGEWFPVLLGRVASAYNLNARAEYLQRKYPGLPRDDIADRLISVVTRYATVAGAVTGATASAAEAAAVATGGLSAPATAGVLAGSIGTEMAYLSTIQMRLVFDLSVVYDVHLDLDDPEDVLLVFGYALGVAPVDVVGSLAQHAASSGTKVAVKKVLSKETLKAVQQVGKKVGFHILQRSVVKYAVPVASAVVGSGFNYASTRSMGAIAKAHFRNRGRVTDEIRNLVQRQNTYDIVFPAAAMYMANVDGTVTTQERETYEALLTRMTFPDHTQREFHKLLAKDGNLFDAASRVQDEELAYTLIDIIALIAVCDGEFSAPERDFLVAMANALGVNVEIEEIEKRTDDYRLATKRDLPAEVKTNVKEAATRLRGAVERMRQRKAAPQPAVEISVPPAD